MFHHTQRVCIYCKVKYSPEVHWQKRLLLSSLQPSWATENWNKQRAFTTEILCLSFEVVQHFQTMPKGINSTQWVIYLKRTQQAFLALPKYIILHKRMLFTAPRCEEQSLYTKVCQSAITCCQYGQMAKRIDWALE